MELALLNNKWNVKSKLGGLSNRSKTRPNNMVIQLPDTKFYCDSDANSFSNESMVPLYQVVKSERTTKDEIKFVSNSIKIIKHSKRKFYPKLKKKRRKKC